MIQIRHINGTVLYTAEHVHDIRKAVEEAAGKRAYLKGANLKGAYLEGAYLKGAYLEGAYLEGAYLEGANLEGAYLEGAYLEGAYLKGANLKGAYLEGAYLKGAYLEGAYLEGAYLEGAYLKGANLKGAYLEGAYLKGAYLEGAYLEGAYLKGAYLEGANLKGANGYNPFAVCDLLMLHDQPGKIRAYKLVTPDGFGPYYGGICFEKGKSYEVEDANTNIEHDCGAGINVATLPWCMKKWEPGFRILVIEFTAEDIAAIPTTTDGKFRLHRCEVVGEKDLKEIGLV